MATARPKLLIEIETFEKELPQLLKDHAGQYALIHGTQIVGIFWRKDQALREGYKQFANGPFLVKRIAKSPRTLCYLSNVKVIERLCAV